MRFYPESRVAGFSDVDGTILFYTRTRALLKPDFVVIDIGCGRGAHRDDTVPIRRTLRTFRGECRRILGIDTDPDAADNPYVDEFHLITGRRWPLPSESADMCICDFVLEHVDDCNAFFGECARVLRKGGYLCLRTANAHSYVGLISRLVPNSLHARVLGRAQGRRLPHDVFPTRYRCNTPRRLRRTLESHGFDAVVYGYEGEPRYASFSRFVYRLAVLHQRLAPTSFRLSLFAFARKSMPFDPVAL